MRDITIVPQDYIAIFRKTNTVIWKQNFTDGCEMYEVRENRIPLVRCRDCEWWKCNQNTEEYGVCKKVSYDDFEVVMNSDDFCSYGKRREDGEA